MVVGIDAKSETVRTDGWLDDSGENYIAFAEPCGVLRREEYHFHRHRQGRHARRTEFRSVAALRASVSCEIIASGRRFTLEDIAALKKLGIDGAIAGEAVYTGTLDLAKAIKEAE
ncbi:MAG: HisA/HisF-related TIM barrel protein [Butyricicoccaceae bacterium]